MLNTVDALWLEALRETNIEDARLLSQSKEDIGRRVYQQGNRVYKIVLPALESTSAVRACTLSEEASILKRLHNVSGTPNRAGYLETAHSTVLSYDYREGLTWNDGSLPNGAWVTLMIRLLVLAVHLSTRGVAHNDIKPENILVNGSGIPTLLDFDQAARVKRRTAFAANFLGWNQLQPSHSSLLGMIKTRIRTRAPRLANRLENSKLVELIRDRITRIPSLPSNPTPQLRALHSAWQLARLSDANAPGKLLSYYSIRVDGFVLPGERPWESRWAILSRAATFEGKRVLELGCNLSLLSCQLLTDKGATSACCVDSDSDILLAAEKVAEAYQVSPCYKRVNFDSPEAWEEDLSAFRPDIVTALSVVNWITDKERFFRFLGRFPEVLFEGHDSVSTEMKRLESVGFTVIDLIATSERDRPVLRARKA